VIVALVGVERSIVNETPAMDGFSRTVVAVAMVMVIAVWLAESAAAVWLDLPQRGTKCVSEEIQPNVVVLADYSLMFEGSAYNHPTMGVKVILSASCALIWMLELD
jgi:hypothetical protein